MSSNQTSERRSIRFVADDAELNADEFLGLAQKVWPGDYEAVRTEQALRRTTNITAREGDRRVGCVRILSDGYFFGTIPELLVDPACQGRSIGRALMERAWEASSTSLCFGAQRGEESRSQSLDMARTIPLPEKIASRAKLTVGVGVT